MADLEQQALRTVAPGLPKFQGASIPEQLADGRARARAVILKYVPDFKFDVAAARDVMSQVSVWIDHNQSQLAQALEPGAKDLPQKLQLLMGNSKQVQQWVVANYTIAAVGMGPWESGKVARLVEDPNSNLSAAWAKSDAADRLEAFGLIVKMENDGDMERIFLPPPAVAGFGVAAVIVWAIVVTVVALAAVIVTYFFLARRLQVNNGLMRDMCIKAQEEGDRATIEKCVEATRDLQSGDPLSALTSEVGKIVLVAGGGYLAFRYGIPYLLDRFSGKKERRA